MIRFHAKQVDGRKAIGIGLTRDVLERIEKHGEVASFCLDDIGGSGDVIIFFAEDNNEAVDRMRESGINVQENNLSSLGTECN